MGLTAVGRCRIHPSSSSSARTRTEYQAIVQFNTQQAHVDLNNNDSNNNEKNNQKKQLQKKYMKQGVAAAKTLLMETLQLDVSVVDAEVMLPAEDVIRTDGCLASCFLDAGCQTVVINVGDGTKNIDAALDAAKIPKERLMAHFVVGTDDNNDYQSISDAMAKVEQFCSSVSVELVKQQQLKITEDKLLAIMNSTNNMHVAVHISPNELGLSDDEDLAAMVGKVCTQSTAACGTIALIDPTVSQLGLSYAACIKSDRPDGLYTTVVCSRSGEALGLVYSSNLSIVAALECGRGVYYSRSRQALWRKGDTSGHFQTLHRLDVDCDGDALRFTVTQRTGNEEAPPAFCHLQTYTCWGAPRGLRHLEETLQDRLKSAPEGSYTKRLFDDSQLLRDKLVEEAQELSEADTPQHVAEELADVLYFAMTRAAKAGVSMDDAVAELDRRTRKVTRRKGDSKAFRIAAGQAILDKNQS